MKRSWALLAVLALGLVASQLQWQPSGFARVRRRGARVRVLRHRVDWALRLGDSCFLPLEEADLRATLPPVGALGSARRLEIRFEPPRQVPLDWPPGDFCHALALRVERLGAGDAEGLRLALEQDGLQVRGLKLIGAQAAREPLAVPEVARLSQKTRPLVFVGLDGADWQLLDRFMAAGSMPNLSALVREGTGGTLQTLHPPLSPLVWTTMLTGVSPLEHGVLDFARFSPLTGKKEPITSDERRVPAIWNMATYAGRRVAVLGMWATYPAEPVRGLVVSDRLFSFLYKEDQPPPGVVFPPEREADARAFLTQAEAQVGFSELKRYLPWLTEADYASHAATENPYGHPVSALRRILIETSVYDAFAMQLLKTHDPPDLTLLYLQGTDSIGHVFAPYAPPRQASVSAEDYAKYSAVPERYFAAIDAQLGRYRAAAHSLGATLMLASDHGFRWSEGRPTALSSADITTAARWHRDQGIFLLWGPGIASAPGHRGAGNVAQVCATLLSLLGLPGDSRLAKPLVAPAAPSSGAQVEYADYFARPAPAAPGSASVAADDEAIAKLRALGYVGAETGKARRPAGGSTRSAGSYNNEGLLLQERDERDKAIVAFEKALEVEPTLASALWNLSNLLFAEHRELDRSDQLLVQAFASGMPEGAKYLIGRAIGYQRAGQGDRSLRLMEAAAAARPEDATVWLFDGRYRVETGDCQGALHAFEKAVALNPKDPAGYASLGLAQLCVGDRSAARTSFGRSLALDPQQPKLREFLREP